MNPTKSSAVVNSPTAAGTRRDTLTITDNRNGQQYEIPIKNDTIRAIDLRQIKINEPRFRDDELRPRLHQHRRLAPAKLLSSTATKASCVTAAIPSKNWPKRAPISRPPT